MDRCVGEGRSTCDHSVDFARRFVEQSLNASGWEGECAGVVVDEDEADLGGAGGVVEWGRGHGGEVGAGEC